MKKFFYFFLISSIFFAACKPEEEEVSDNYNRKEMLKNIVDGIISPSYNQLIFDLNSLKDEVEIFSSNPSSSQLSIVRSKWIDAYKTWQYVEMFNIERAQLLRYNLRMNSYPANTSDIDDNILNEVTDISLYTPAVFATQGFPAIDYLLYGLDADSNMVINYYNGNNGSKHFAYLNLLVNTMINHTNDIISSWSSIRNSFVNNTENSATGSVNKLANDFVYYYEKGFRANKIGIPAGRYSNTTLPTKVEAFYKRDLSKTLCLAALDASENFFIGKHFNSNQTGASLKDYVDYIATNSNLSSEILGHFSTAREKINLLSDDFYAQVQNDNLSMVLAFDAVQKNVISMKTDMLFLLNISVDYVDSDGD